MQFHQYLTLRNRSIKVHQRIGEWIDHSPTILSDLQAMNSSEWRRYMMKLVMESVEQDEGDKIDLHQAISEEVWIKDFRPYYNVWPIALELCDAVTIDIRFSEISLPTSTMLFCFPKGFEPEGIRFSLLDWNPDDHRIIIHSFTKEDETETCILSAYHPDDVVESLIDETFKSEHGNLYLLVRLSIFTSLLHGSPEMITPIVLAKDRPKYESTTDEDLKKRILERAIRNRGLGHDLGKNIQNEKDRTTHWRNPHFGIRYTGIGRTVPKLVPIRGSVVGRKHITDVPTGYLGPEDFSKDDWIDEENQRIPLSPSKRFDIFKQDNYTCQICGRNVKEDCVKLHVDHIIPISKGGTNDEDNLQTACQDCNLGKSDKEMQ